MRERKFVRAKPTHPEMQGQELEVIPVRSRTVRKLHRTVAKKLAGEMDGRIATGEGFYDVRRYPYPAWGSSFSLEFRTLGRTATVIRYTTTAETTRRRSQTRMRKVEYKPTQVDKPSSSADLPSQMMALVRRVTHDSAVAERDQREMAELTGLPRISEGEVRNVIEDISSGFFIAKP